MAPYKSIDCCHQISIIKSLKDKQLFESNLSLDVFLKNVKLTQPSLDVPYLSTSRHYFKELHTTIDFPMAKSQKRRSDIVTSDKAVVIFHLL